MREVFNKILCFDPVVAFKNPSEYWIDYQKISPIYNLGLLNSTINKLSLCEIRYECELMSLSRSTLIARANLTSAEIDDLDICLSESFIKLPEIGDYTYNDKVLLLKNDLSRDVINIKTMADSGSVEAAFIYAKIASYTAPTVAYEEDCYKKAIALGSCQASNDFGALQLRKKNCNRLSLEAIKKMFEVALSGGVWEAGVNLILIDQIIVENNRILGHPIH